MAKRRAHGEGTVFRRRDGRYVAELIVGIRPDGRPLIWRKYGRRKAEVVEALQIAREQYRHGTLVVPSRWTVNEYLEHWIETTKGERRPGVTYRYLSVIRNHIVPHLGHYRLNQLQVVVLQDWMRTLLEKSPVIYQSARKVLHIALNQAVESRILPQNPLEFLRTPRVLRVRTPCRQSLWSITDAQRFVRAMMDDPDGVLWILAIVSGARIGELLGLRWQDIDWGNGVITITRDVDIVVGHGAIADDLKSSSSYRIIAVPDIMLTQLKRQRGIVAEMQTLAGDAWVDNDLVFPHPTGGFRRRDVANKTFHRIIERLALPPIRLHDLRHLSGTLLSTLGVDLKTIQARLGHANASITANVYLHAVSELDRLAANRLGQLFSGDV